MPRIKSIIAITIITFSLFLFQDCSRWNRGQKFYFTRFHMDTVVEYTLIAANENKARKAMLKADAEIERVSSLFWEEDSGSYLFRFNQSAGGVSVNREVYEVLSRAFGYYSSTGGYFNPAIKPVLDLYPFQGDSFYVPSPVEIERRLELTRMRDLYLEACNDTFFLGKRSSGMELTVGGFVKGYAVDRAVLKLRKEGIAGGIVNAGGDLYCFGASSEAGWRIGIRHPREKGEIFLVINLDDLAVATSGDYERYFILDGVRYHHLLNPFNGRPANEVISATVVASTTEKADALATAVFTMGIQKGLQLLNEMGGVEGVIIDSRLQPHFSRGFKLFLEN